MIAGLLYNHRDVIKETVAMANAGERIELGDHGISLEMDGSKAYFNYFWLRDNCPSAWDVDTQERIYDILKEPDDLRITQAKMDSDSLKVTWLGGYQNEYSLSWLARWHTGKNHGDIAIRKRKAWYADHYPALRRFSYPSLSQSPANVAEWTEALLDEGITLVEQMPDSSEGLLSLCELIGMVRSSFSGYNFDVFSKKNPENLAYTAKALELHTDLPAEESAPGIQFLHCRKNDATGGNSLFVDAVAVAKDLEKEHFDFFKVLTEFETPFRYTTQHHDVRAKQYIIELDPETKEVSGINFSQHMADVFDFAPEKMDVFYPAFRKFGQMMLDKKYLMTFRLNAGECIVFDNHRIAHGRAEYDEGSGERYLRGCYVDRGELRSKYRVLGAKYRIAS